MSDVRWHISGVENAKSMPNIDNKCSKHFTFRDLVECGETWRSSSLNNLPEQKYSWDALSDLAYFILDPTKEQFGSLVLTYGFCSQKLASARMRLSREQGILPGIYPSLDQHGCYERNSKGEPVCERGGAACDFLIQNISSLKVAEWIVRQLPFDRLYYYGAERPLHVSYNRQGSSGEVSVMKPKQAGKGYIPVTLKSNTFLERYCDDL